MKAPDWLLLAYGSTTSQFARGSTRCCINTASQDVSSWSVPKVLKCPTVPAIGATRPMPRSAFRNNSAISQFRGWIS